MFNLGYVSKLIGLFAFALLLTSCTQAPSESHLTGHTTVSYTHLTLPTTPYV